MPKKKTDPFEKTTARRARPLGYEQCWYEANSQQCRYPGSISPHTNGSGPWYCTAHDKLLMDRASPTIGAQIVTASKAYNHSTNWDRVDQAARQRKTAPRFNRDNWKPYPARTQRPDG